MPCNCGRTSPQVACNLHDRPVQILAAAGLGAMTRSPDFHFPERFWPPRYAFTHKTATRNRFQQCYAVLSQQRPVAFSHRALV